MSIPKLKIVIAAGGSGGHLVPAQQLAKQLLEKEVQILFAAEGVEKNPFLEKNFPCKNIASAPLKKSFKIKPLVYFFYSLSKGLFQSFFLLKRFKPDLVVGFGSYHTFPVLLAAKMLKKPLVLFEPNCVLGRVNRFFARGAKKIAIQFPLGGVYQGKKDSSVFVPFLPWGKKNERPKEEARESLGLQKDLFTFLVFGGSQGAEFISDAFCDWIEKENVVKNFQVIHLTGKNVQKEEFFKKFYRDKKIVSYVRGYEKEMEKLFVAADFVICRSGASTLGELITFEKPSLLIPYPFSMDGHQEKNALFMQEVVKGGVVVHQSEGKEAFFSAIKKIISSKETFRKMEEQIKNFKILEEDKEKKELLELVLEVGRKL